LCEILLCGLLLRRGLDVYEGDLEDDRAVGGDGLAGALGSIGEGRGDGELVLAAHVHELEAFGPAGDDLVQGDEGGLAAGDRGVEGRAVEELADVVDLDRVGGLGARARALRDDLVLEAARRGDDAGLLAVLGQVLRLGGDVLLWPSSRWRRPGRPGRSRWPSRG